MEDETRTPTGWPQENDATGPPPNTAPLAVMGLAFGVLSAILALTVYLTMFAVLGALVALVLGVLALGDERSRGLGIGAIVMAVLAMVCAAVVVVSLW
ncbi:hypothetical protein [Nocardioides okcheonensis]|uniref:hypothetical protein n=1 Tax=Nocardioides okcheonensis TaxID=2894081 RepID=UPI001E3FC0B6|nr:hypothetical protein [Nocardioides okcheonensis]UFN45693.1 hypothetical protein LN652_05640 [Nocardioides okcheonensis]